ncbi:hypothetical protein T440DRAFT_499447 [Plenodomus tracheiphilus IPT5]|uniref:DUF3128 domain-containing protein n=1 Tax=Plenodomus tracheiphilus IPT5 TaxID=1408161 RepID=A0A6A7B626_9PLEO|nr:hypothetical protein T440DRAFT_499447 [Plenodomus tracheiphilus IPT5]
MSWWPFSKRNSDASPAQPQITPQIPLQTQSIPPTTAPHDPDFYAAHPHLAPPSFSTPSTSTAPSPNDAPSTTTDEPLDPSLPRTMSCRAAFDSAFYCSSLGGHFNDLYRYGQLRSCSDHWNDFWFCMRTKNSYSGRDVKERMVQDRYREKEVKLLSGPNSEDVWVRRGPGEEVRGAFGAGMGVQRDDGER